MHVMSEPWVLQLLYIYIYIHVDLYKKMNIISILNSYMYIYEYQQGRSIYM